jgi:hypothetical protein
MTKQTIVANTRKGQGWTEAGTSLECTAKGGKVL